MVVNGISSFAEIEVWLSAMPDQMTGIQCAVCQTGEPYVEFRETALARPADIKIVEAHVAAVMHMRLHEYLDSRRGIVYWRIPFESDVSPSRVIVRYDELGADVDPISNLKCIMDKGWVRVACYCRLYRASQAFEGYDFTVTPKPTQATKAA